MRLEWEEALAVLATIAEPTDSALREHAFLSLGAHRGEQLGLDRQPLAGTPPAYGRLSRWRRCRVSRDTRPMKCPMKGRQPGQHTTPAFTRDRARRPPTPALLPWDEQRKRTSRLLLLDWSSRDIRPRQWPLAAELGGGCREKAPESPARRTVGLKRHLSARMTALSHRKHGAIAPHMAASHGPLMHRANE